MRKAIWLVMLGACGDDHMEGDAMTEHVGEAAAHVEDMRTAIEAHGAAIDAAADLAAVLEEEARHAEEAGGHHAEIEHETEEMAECEDDGGMHPDMAEMSGMADACGAELAAHEKVMAAAADLDAAEAEEARHQAAMADMLGEMATMSDGMMDMAGSFSCEMHEDMHE
ncbi:MAG: hypothetical protein AABZ30_02370 [Myxococcota bacterium]